MPRAHYDAETDILYVTLSENAKVGRQQCLDDFRIIDYSTDGTVVGVEFICATDGIDLGDVPFAQKVEDLIGRSGHQFKIFA